MVLLRLNRFWNVLAGLAVWRIWRQFVKSESILAADAARKGIVWINVLYKNFFINFEKKFKFGKFWLLLKLIWERFFVCVQFFMAWLFDAKAFWSFTHMVSFSQWKRKLCWYFQGNLYSCIRIACIFLFFMFFISIFWAIYSFVWIFFSLKLFFLFGNTFFGNQEASSKIFCEFLIFCCWFEFQVKIVKI